MGNGAEAERAVRLVEKMETQEDSWGEKKTKLFQEAKGKRLAFSCSKALFYEYNNLGRSYNPHVKDEDPKSRRGKATSPGAEASQVNKVVSDRTRRATKLSDTSSMTPQLPSGGGWVDVGS